MTTRLDIDRDMRDDLCMTNINLISFDDIMTRISDYALALRSDSTATDSTLDDLQYDLDCIFEHDAIDDADEHLTPDRTSFDAYCFHDLNPDLSDATIDNQIDSLHAITNHLFNLRP